MIQHTPGPWRIEIVEQHDYPHLCVVFDSPTRSQLVADLHSPFRIFPDGTQEVHENKMANARLIAAAPEMLETLIQCAAWFERFAPVADLINGRKAELPMLAAVRKVIAKTKGE